MTLSKLATFIKLHREQKKLSRTAYIDRYQLGTTAARIEKLERGEIFDVRKCYDILTKIGFIVN